MRGGRRLAAAVVVAGLAGGLALAAGWLSPAGVMGAAAGLLYGIRVPALDDPAMVRRGAGHYDRVCARCHGSPERPAQGRDLSLSPPPPTLHLRLRDWPPEMLFKVVRDGIPHSAMPAWPAPTREDEVWAMVAFLQALPDMSAAEYRRAAGQPATEAAVPPVIRVCAQCHGLDGRGEGEAFPRIDLQTESYLREALTAFHTGRRASGIMQAATIALTQAEIAAAARHYAARLPPLPMTADPPPLVVRGDPARNIAACGLCHGPPAPIRPEVPRLAGQHAGYLAQQLRLFVAESRGGGRLAALMHHAAGDLTEGEIQDLARWYAAQPAP